MIKVEKGMREIKAVNGVPDIMTDLACIIRSIRTTMVEKRDYSEAETKELVKQAVKHYFIERTEVQADLDYLQEEEIKFWKYVESGRKPPLILPEI